MRWLGLVVCLVAASAAAQTRGRINTNGGRVAIGGYDPVAYFEDRRPTRGVAQHATSWGGATWHFASAEHLAAFVARPRRYAPQYGGYCAFAMSRGDVVRIDPNAWTITGGKLYLNYSLGIRRQWSADRATFIERANEHWTTVRRTL